MQVIGIEAPPDLMWMKKKKKKKILTHVAAGICISLRTFMNINKHNKLVSIEFD